MKKIKHILNWILARIFGKTIIGFDESIYGDYVTIVKVWRGETYIIKSGFSNKKLSKLK